MRRCWRGHLRRGAGLRPEIVCAPARLRLSRPPPASGRLPRSAFASGYLKRGAPPSPVPRLGRHSKAGSNKTLRSPRPWLRVWFSRSDAPPHGLLLQPLAVVSWLHVDQERHIAVARAAVFRAFPVKVARGGRRYCHRLSLVPRKVNIDPEAGH